MVKKGFSLAEALVVMAIIAILFSCASKVITTKPQPKRQLTSHGYFECYLDGATLMQRYVRENVESSLSSAGGSCRFEPPSGVAFFNINTYGTVLYSDFQPNINNDLSIIIDGSNIRIESTTGSLTLSSNEDAENMRNYFKLTYPDSKIYNSGAMRTGLMISW